jgi:hypothetical protein
MNRCLEKSRSSRTFPALFGAIALAVGLGAAPASARHGELPNRIPEPAPYDTQEAKLHPPPYDKYFATTGSPGVCATCHKQIFEEWNGSMMSNAWRDPVWRAAFFLITKLTSTDGSCGIPNPPDGTEKSKINPFANADCTSTFNLGPAPYTMKGPGSLMDGFCSRCHMPANYIDSVKPKNITIDEPSGLEHGLIDPDFNPTSARGTPYAYATATDGGSQNDDAGKDGITCTFCHTAAETRYTPFHNYPKSGVEYHAAHGKLTRDKGLTADFREMLTPSDPASRNLGYGVGAGAYRVSPEAISLFERFGPLTNQDHTSEVDPYVSSVFKTPIAFQHGKFSVAPHKGNYSKLYERAEMCSTCHDVTNPLTIKNTLGRWVGGFPIERTYSEWASSRYADRPGNENFQPAFKRDCQTCHMQQDFGQPGTAQTLYADGLPVPPRVGTLATGAPERPITFSHHFVGGNTYSTRVIGAAVTPQGKAQPYPELSAASFSSADHDSPYHNAFWENVTDRGPQTQHARFAWDRLRHAVEVQLTAPSDVKPGTNAALRVSVANTGTGHDFPTGFPEGRNAWLAVRALDLHTGSELEIDDAFWKRRTKGVGYLTNKDSVDPNFPGCNWQVPAGGPDPYAFQFRAVASLGNGCPTLELPYATPLNMVMNSDGLPIDVDGKVIGRNNPLGLPQFKDVDGDGDLYDDAFLLDTRLRPMPNRDATLTLDRYSVVIPPNTVGPIAVTAAVYYQSMEAVVAKKFMGNMADTDLDHVLEPCVLNGPCDGREPHTEPAVVEGAPPVPIRLTTTTLTVSGQIDTALPVVNVYPPAMANHVYSDVVVKFTSSKPLQHVDAGVFSLHDAKGVVLPAEVAQIGDLTWALFPRRVFLEPGKTYTAQLGIVCDASSKCSDRFRQWHFTIAAKADEALGNTSLPAIPQPEPPVLSAPKPTGPDVISRTLPWIGIALLGGAGAVLLLALLEALKRRHA